MAAEVELAAVNKWANGEHLSPEEQALVVRSAARSGHAIDAERLRRAEEAKAQLPELKHRAELCEAQYRESLANAEKQFALAMKGKIDDCLAATLSGDDFLPATPLPRCTLNELVMVLPSPNKKSGVELFLGDLGPRIGILESLRAAEICRQITEDDRKWAATIFSITEATPEFPEIVTLMFYRVTPEYWEQLMSNGA